MAQFIFVNTTANESMANIDELIRNYKIRAPYDLYFTIEELTDPSNNRASKPPNAWILFLKDFSVRARVENRHPQKISTDAAAEYRQLTQEQNQFFNILSQYAARKHRSLPPPPPPPTTT